jgi:isopenicillin N synthase-like dioxygenase
VLAASSVGFFYIAGHGVAEEVLDSARQHANALFTQLPPEKLDALHVRHSWSKARGYQRVGENVTEGRRDQHEAFDLYRDAPIVDDAATARHGLQGKNPWPDAALPGFRPFFEREYTVAMLALGGRLCQGLALGLGLPDERYFEPFFDESFWVLRLIRYPSGGNLSRPQSIHRSSMGLTEDASPATEEELLGCGKHTDYGCWTIVNQDQDPRLGSCLEAETLDGAWMPVPHRPGCLPVGVAFLSLFVYPSRAASGSKLVPLYFYCFLSQPRTTFHCRSMLGTCWRGGQGGSCAPRPTA